jgi:hypothetical protein
LGHNPYKNLHPWWYSQVPNVRLVRSHQPALFDEDKKDFIVKTVAVKVVHSLAVVRHVAILGVNHIQSRLKGIQFFITLTKRVTFKILVGTSMGGLVVAEVGLTMMVVVIIEVGVMIEIVAWSAMDQDASRRMWLTLLVSRVQVSVICLPS